MSSVADHGATLEDAVAFAAAAHRGQRRKGSGTPYIVHPMEVAAICARLTDDQDVIIAGVLHDVVEDTPVGLDEVRERFGPRVASIVAGESEDKQEGKPARDTWRQRKQATIDHMHSTEEPGERIVCLADKLSNMRSMLHDFAALGDGLWSRFNVSDPRQQGWYYRTLGEALRPQLGDTHEWREYDVLVREVFGEEG